MKMHRGVDIWIHVSLTRILVGSEWLASRPCRFTPRKRAASTLDRRLGGPQSVSGRYVLPFVYLVYLTMCSVAQLHSVELYDHSE
jgi:hypothetical protein